MHVFYFQSKMGTLKEYIIKFVGLKEGKHIFNYTIEDKFFTLFEKSLINKALIQVRVELDKTSNLLTLMFYITGKLIQQCDRCLEDVDIPIETEEKLIVEFGDQASDISDVDNIQILEHSATELNIAQHIYDYITLQVPYRTIHPDDANGKPTCNPEMLAKLNEHLTNNNEDTDPRWDKLKSLLN